MLGRGDGQFGKLFPCCFFASQNPIECIRSLVDECLRVVLERVKILESDVPRVADRLERLHDGGPVGGAIEEGAERVKSMIRTFLGELLEVYVPDPLAQDRDPVLREL